MFKSQNLDRWSVSSVKGTHTISFPICPFLKLLSAIWLTMRFMAILFPQRAFSSKDSSSSNGNDEDEDADDVKGGLGDPSNDDEGGGPNGGAPDLIKTDGEDTSELLSKVESIQGGLLDMLHTFLDTM
jgi:hypothetical protein